MVVEIWKLVVTAMVTVVVVVDDGDRDHSSWTVDVADVDDIVAWKRLVAPRNVDFLRTATTTTVCTFYCHCWVEPTWMASSRGVGHLSLV